MSTATSPGIRPLHDQVIIRQIFDEPTYRGLIIRPDTALKRKFEGEVLAVGPGARQKDGTRRPMPVKVGDKVIYDKYKGRNLDMVGSASLDEDLLVLTEAEIAAVYE